MISLGAPSILDAQSRGGIELPLPIVSVFRITRLNLHWDFPYHFLLPSYLYLYPIHYNLEACKSGQDKSNNPLRIVNVCLI